MLRAHIRQLIYISLYPPPPSKAAAGDKGKRKESTIISGSPSKQIQAARRLQKQALFPPPEATEAAKELLHQYAIDSISPEALLRAVPCFPLSEAELESAPRPIKEEMFFGNSDVFEDMDSYVAKQAARLKQCKDCWDILRKDIVTRQDLALLQKGDPFLDEDAEDETEEADLSSAVLGRHSWHLLEWFILLFEKDEALAGNLEDANEGRLQYVNCFVLLTLRFRILFCPVAFTIKACIKNWRSTFSYRLGCRDFVLVL